LKYIVTIALSICAAGFACAQSPMLTDPMLPDEAVQISAHVWAIMGFPNIGIVVGARATLVIDTGLGPRNGATAARVALRLAPNNKLYLTTTHFHPEHAAGESGFPAGTVLIRDSVQQREMDAHGREMIDMFAGRSTQWKDLLADAPLRKPDIEFKDEYSIDLGGGVRARLLWFGGAHTKGDELTFVEPDKTLISGDVVQNKVVPNIYGDGGTPQSWIGVLDRVGSLGARHVLPDHSDPGDGSLIVSERKFMVELSDRALDMKRRGISVDETGETLSEEFRAKYPDWHIKSVAGFVKSIYAE
jgi:glyoxylase-like metal-dependent hydrolase (beta-lactamase superfamily II)